MGATRVDDDGAAAAARTLGTGELQLNGRVVHANQLADGAHGLALEARAGQLVRGDPRGRRHLARAACKGEGKTRERMQSRAHDAVRARVRDGRAEAAWRGERGQQHREREESDSAQERESDGDRAWRAEEWR